MNNDVDLFYIQKEECSLSFSISHVKKYSVTHDHVARKPCQVYVFFDPIATRNLILKRVWIQANLLTYHVSKIGSRFKFFCSNSEANKCIKFNESFRMHVMIVVSKLDKKIKLQQISR